jgi:GT2 family glycosyltransferase
MRTFFVRARLGSFK